MSMLKTLSICYRDRLRYDDSHYSPKRGATRFVNATSVERARALCGYKLCLPFVCDIYYIRVAAGFSKTHFDASTIDDICQGRVLCSGPIFLL